MSRTQAVYDFCAICTGKSNVRVCPSTDCKLWPFRMYVEPKERHVLMSPEWFDARSHLSESDMKKAIREALK